MKSLYFDKVHDISPKTEGVATSTFASTSASSSTVVHYPSSSSDAYLKSNQTTNTSRKESRHFAASSSKVVTTTAFTGGASPYGNVSNEKLQQNYGDVLNQADVFEVQPENHVISSDNKGINSKTQLSSISSKSSKRKRETGWLIFFFF